MQYLPTHGQPPRAAFNLARKKLYLYGRVCPGVGVSDSRGPMAEEFEQLLRGTTSPRATVDLHRRPWGDVRGRGRSEAAAARNGQCRRSTRTTAMQITIS
jgi:hypothetical protein